MKTVQLGRTGVKVSELCFGTMTMGGDADEAESGKMYAACRDAGVNFFDCANMYNNGLSEEILGRLAAHERDEVVITSKAGFGRRDGGLEGCGRRALMSAVDATLKRLGTDRVDVYFIHGFDPETPLEQTFRAMDDIVRAGKALHIGVSNYPAWRTAAVLGLQRREGWAPVDVIQPMYNLIKRQAESEILPMARAEGLAVTPYGPAGGGFLSGKYSGRKIPKGVRLDNTSNYIKRYDQDWYYETADALAALAAEWGHHPVSLAVAWAAAHPDVTSPIFSARSVEQLQAGLGAAEIDLSPKQRAQISALSRTPSPATDRSDETED
ncbi:MAG: aldo/keto reductase [Rhodospirillales bacterium]